MLSRSHHTQCPGLAISGCFGSPATISIQAKLQSFLSYLYVAINRCFLIPDCQCYRKQNTSKKILRNSTTELQRKIAKTSLSQPQKGVKLRLTFYLPVVKCHHAFPLFVVSATDSSYVSRKPVCLNFSVHPDCSMHGNQRKTIVFFEYVIRFWKTNGSRFWKKNYKLKNVINCRYLIFNFVFFFRY